MRKTALKNVDDDSYLKLYVWSGGEVTGDHIYRLKRTETTNLGICIALVDDEGNEKRYAFLSPETQVTVVDGPPVERTELQRLKDGIAEIKTALEWERPGHVKAFEIGEIIKRLEMEEKR